MNSLGVSSHGSFLESLRQSRVSVASASNILSAGTVLNGQHTLSNHLTSVRANNVDTENPVSLLVGDELDHTLSVEVGLGTRVGGEGEGSDVVLAAGSLNLLLGLTNPGGLRVGVHDGGDGGVVDVAVSALDILNSGDTLLLSLVRKHGTKGHITDGTDVGDLGAVLLVNDDAATLVNLDPNVLEAEAFGVCAATDGDKDDVGIKLIIFVS